MTPADLLTATGEALYGPQWRSYLAADLGLNRRTLWYYTSGQGEPPAAFWASLAAIVGNRTARLAELVKPLSEAARGS